MILEVIWHGLWTLSFGSHNVMVTALGLCMKWPLVSLILFVVLKGRPHMFKNAGFKTEFGKPR